MTQLYLKALEIQGFKSFPDKTVLNFGEDITAIVGPNGSGKSNISDAIRWVMGEQNSRQLRGAKMEDVIFGGTEKRNQMGFAQVTLVIDNTEHIFPTREEAEVAVTRRYYRSGESEYYINKQSVRLKDVNELFMDTGMGREGYSIIGQGKIDEILSVKSGERREIFEEAAGISKYRHRKEESERKLERTEENLVRINDKIAELELQVEPLRAQAETAKKYLVLRDELRVLEISVWLEQLQNLRTAKLKLESDTAQAKEACDQAQATLDEAYAQGESFTEEMRQNDVAADALRGQVTEAESAAGEESAAIAVLQTSVEHNNESLRRLEQELTSTDQRRENLQGQIDGQLARIADIDRDAAVLETALSELLSRAQALADSAKGAADEAEALRAQEAIAVAEAADGRAALSALQAGLDEAGQRRITVRQELSEAQRKLEESEKDAKTNRRALNDAREEAQAAENIIQGHSLRMDSRRQKAQSAQDAKQELTRQVNAQEDRIRLLTEMEKEYEGFNKAVKTVMQAAEKNTLRGIHGPVAGLMTTEQTYAVALETALGAALQNIVVEREEDAKAAIQFLKQRDGGRATFLPLTAIRGDELRENAAGEYGFVGIASRLVRYDARYDYIFKNLLGRTVVVEDLDCGVNMARRYQNRFRIVTLDGQIIQPGGAMTGGSASRGTGALARAGRLRAAEEQAERCEAARKTAEQRFRAAEKRLHACETACETQNAALRRQAEAQAALAAACTQHRALLGSAQARQEELMQQQRSMEAEKQRSAEVLASFDAREAQAGTQLRDAETRVQTCRDALARLRTEAAEQEAQLAGQRTALTRTEAELSGEKRALEQMRALRCETDAGLSSAADSIKRYECECERMQDELAEEKAAHERSETLAHTLREQLEQTGKRREQVEERRTAVRRDAQDAGEQILGMEREASRLENRAGQLKAEEAQLLGRMWESYELTPTPAAALAQPIDDPAAARERAHELRGEIRALGSVNPDAVEEYRRVRERYAFMGGQKDDLERAQRELYRVIDRLTVNMKEIFASEFARLNVLFGQTFREIFGGGHAELALADTSDILSCGIDIRVSPPGKAVKTITLLSGGEKAFVAITLYFAILKLRPAPFCVLDEIEAALDDVNVQRYAKYIRKLTDFTQFIVITHRRGTMEEADMLYGVTMQEQGVSKLLMLNLAEAEKRLKNTIK